MSFVKLIGDVSVKMVSKNRNIKLKGFVLDGYNHEFSYMVSYYKGMPSMVNFIDNETGLIIFRDDFNVVIRYLNNPKDYTDDSIVEEFLNNFFDREENVKAFIDGYEKNKDDAKDYPFNQYKPRKKVERFKLFQKFDYWVNGEKYQFEILNNNYIVNNYCPLLNKNNNDFIEFEKVKVHEVVFEHIKNKELKFGIGNYRLTNKEGKEQNDICLVDIETGLVLMFLCDGKTITKNKMYSVISNIDRFFKEFDEERIIQKLKKAKKVFKFDDPYYLNTMNSEKYNECYKELKD